MTPPAGSPDDDPIPRSGWRLLSPAFWMMMAFAALCLAGTLFMWLAAPRLGLIRSAPRPSPARAALAHGPGDVREAAIPLASGLAGC